MFQLVVVKIYRNDTFGIKSDVDRFLYSKGYKTSIATVREDFRVRHYAIFSKADLEGNLFKANQ